MTQFQSQKRRSHFSPSGFRDLISGRRRGAVAAVLRGALAIVEVPYTWAVQRRNRRYDRGTNPTYRVEVPVICVGNLTLGGTGKTPMVQWIARQLLDQGKNVGIISRGYAAVRWTSESVANTTTDSEVHPTKLNDEALELAWKLPGVPHVQNPDRLAAARRAIDQLGCDVLVLDDGFQHRRIARDLDIVLLDALEPLGFEHVFPRGTLREPVEGLSRANVIALSRADLLPEHQRKLLRERVAKLSPAAAWAEIIHAPQELVAVQSVNEDVPFSSPLATLRGRRVLAFCGLGNPAGFRHTLTACQYEVAEFREFPDHHAYRPADLDSLAAAAERLEVEAVVCTEKDLVKIGCNQLGDRPLYAVRVGIDFLAGREELLRQVSRLLQSSPCATHHPEA